MRSAAPWLAALAFLAPHPAWGQGAARPDPVGDSSIPVGGWPVYVEDLTVGSPVSDYGSHMGLKASTIDDADLARPLAIDARTLLAHAEYVATTDDGRQMDQGFLTFLDEAGADRFAPAEERSVEFRPWGWREEAQSGALRARGVVRTLARNLFLVGATVENGGDETARLTPVFTLQNDLDPQIESNFPSSPTEDFTTARLADGVLGVTYTAPRILGLFGFRTFHRAFAAAPAPATLASDGGLTLYRHRLKLSPIEVAPGGRAGAYVAIGFGQSEAEAAERANEGLARMATFGADPADALDAADADAEAEWDAFFAALPHPRTDRAEDRRLYDLAATALRMNVYGARNRMSADASVPSKAHFNFFFVWDTPLQALGHLEYDPALAAGDLRVAYEFDATSSRTPLPMLEDDFLRISPTNLGDAISQPPVHGWVQDRLLDAGVDDPAFLGAALDFGERYVEWWRADRDRAGRGTFSWLFGLESGWDDQPALDCPLAPNSFCFTGATDVEALDLTTWIYLYERSLARFARALGEDARADVHRERADAVAEAIESRLWSEADGAYLHRFPGDAPFTDRGLSPSMVFPLFAGITRDPERARRVLEDHILNPEEFWFRPGDGRLPVPSVAYDNEAFDAAQDGYYWQGAMWLVPNWIVATALFRYGYEAEAAALVRRTLDGLYAAAPNGVYEAYDSRGAGVGWGSGGVGEPSAFQFGWSSALLMHLMLGRHERERFAMPGEARVSGRIARIEDLDGGRVLYEVLSPKTLNVPRVVLSSADGGALGEAPAVEVALTDPWDNVPADSVRVRLRPSAGSSVVEIAPDGGRRPVAVEGDDGLVFDARVAGPGEAPTRYVAGDVEVVGLGSTSERCGCAAVAGESGPSGSLGTGVALLAWVAARFVYRNRRRTRRAARAT
ncbi:MAG: hypothetical protein KC466_05255 [Myxococcales bacterium]|nr:hypothetical protein [Myxococcales bacterium]